MPKPASLRLVLVLLAAALTPATRAADLMVFAAASLSDALQECAQQYEPASGDKIRFNLAASSTLARQIQEGAQADLFFSADEAKMDDLARAGLLVAATRRSLLSNTLVVIVPSENAVTPAGRDYLRQAGVRRIALAEPHTVPAGIYACAWLQQAGLWGLLADKVVPTANVRACLAAVESGNVEAGIVYRTDALHSTKVKVIYEVPAAAAPPISYPLAVLKASPHPEAAARFAAWLASPTTEAVFARHGFTVRR